MRLPIQYALTWPDRPAGPCAPLDFNRMTSMTFEHLVTGQFPALALAREAGLQGQTYPTVLSAADEIAVAAFLDGRIRFVDIPPVIEAALGAHAAQPVTSLDVVAEADRWARARATEDIARLTG
jgi:1-deoxy-D-xylulose-5-phosphate reductoisomerase